MQAAYTNQNNLPNGYPFMLTMPNPNPRVDMKGQVNPKHAEGVPYGQEPVV